MSGFLTEQELIKWVGERCTEQEARCSICKAWTRHDLINHMRFEDQNERIQFEYIDYMERSGVLPNVEDEE
jgi:hypothetical protein